jgi:hypothetical protein
MKHYFDLVNAKFTFSVAMMPPASVEVLRGRIATKGWIIPFFFTMDCLKSLEMKVLD